MGNCGTREENAVVPAHAQGNYFPLPGPPSILRIASSVIAGILLGASEFFLVADYYFSFPGISRWDGSVRNRQNTIFASAET
jgi:hypothetical protein